MLFIFFIFLCRQKDETEKTRQGGNHADRDILTQKSQKGFSPRQKTAKRIVFLIINCFTWLA